MNRPGFYVITYTCIFTHGYLKLAMFRRSKEITLPSRQAGIEFATKFRYRWIADLVCRYMNWNSSFTYDLRTWSVTPVYNTQTSNS